jgi:hypothetical protein
MHNKQKSVFKSALDFPTRQLALSLAIIAEQKNLLAVVRTALPPEIAENIQHCVRSGNRLLLYTASASWASQIRFFSMDIVNKLAASGQQNIISLQVRITPQLEQQYRRRSASLPSVENMALLAQQVNGVEKCDVLKSALARLAKTLEKRIKINSIDT